MPTWRLNLTPGPERGWYGFDMEEIYGYIDPNAIESRTLPDITAIDEQGVRVPSLLERVLASAILHRLEHDGHTVEPVSETILPKPEVHTKRREDIFRRLGRSRRS